jgi:hypothetical protein
MTIDKNFKENLKKFKNLQEKLFKSGISSKKNICCRKKINYLPKRKDGAREGKCFECEKIYIDYSEKRLKSEYKH